MNLHIFRPRSSGLARTGSSVEESEQSREGDSPYLATATQDLLERVEKGMKRLSAHDREILVLKNISDASYAEIAQILAISIGAVKSRIIRARKHLHALAFIDHSSNGPRT
jgi:RNA polymerase sigma factor (sigma-70 family)